jgi:hypothetical protein
MPVSINNTSQLDSLLNKYKRVDFVFEFPVLNAEENQLWQAKIKRNYFACGCSMGRIFMIWALLLVVMGIGFNYFFHLGKFPVMGYVYASLFIFIMSGIGKAVGKLSAYKHLKKDIHTLISMLNKVSKQHLPGNNGIDPVKEFRTMQGKPYTDN